MESFKEFILYYTGHFYLVDFMLILFIFFLFACVTLLCVFLRHRPVIALLIIALDIIACFLIFVYGYKFIDSNARARKTTITDQKFLKSSNALAVDFSITNTSKRDFKECKITAKIFKDKLEGDNLLTEYKNKFLPYRKKSREIKELKSNQSQSQRISFEDFTYDNNYTIRLSSECF